ncbi:outer membrane beta-barrel protein [Aliiglaciecola sp. CAU 1673]|uniref:outer membrane beta-barrel protein n=1 Tax=Aliiglaciecola sp. CAU 1673 TaxID=3032595 RepID=UPI0023DC1F90|nr:outer membrane beta-barrel protein [Aliiglaciecola sp. CAU 1673]MDF2178355.1 outer membrane beta-barrel protein [Aliiglaciecola sp. CAU 1673]
MTNRILLAALTGAAMFSASVLAAQPNWNNVQLSYAKLDIDDTDISANGLDLSGSVLVGSNYILQGNFLSVSDEIFGVDVDLDWTSIGMGYRHAITGNTDVFGIVSYESVELSASSRFDSESEDDNGYGLAIGVRSMLNDNIELKGVISRIDIEDAETFIEGSVAYYFAPQFAVGAGYKVGDDMDLFTISARYSF